MKVHALVLASLLPLRSPAGEAPPPYDLEAVEGMDAFEGAEAAREVLSRLGFVVAGRPFKQVFEAYIGSPLPPFVTPDSAWHTYRVLLEEGVRLLDQEAAKRLLDLSRRLLEAAWSASRAGERPLEADLARFAAVGLLLQDPEASSIPEAIRPEAVDCARFLREGAGARRLLFFGLPLLAEHFRASSFYAADPQLRAYFAARQWYALAAFRLRSPAETARALRLALLIEGDRALARLHFYGGNSYLNPRDDFPLVAPVFSSPLRGEVLYAGLGRPEALYLIAPREAVPPAQAAPGRPQAASAKPFVLLRGVVLSYREFTRPYPLLLDDSSWQEEVKAGRAPEPPPFTRSFRAVR